MTESVLEILPGVHLVLRSTNTPRRLEVILDELAAITGDPGQSGPMADCHRIDQLRKLEEIKAAAAAAQARVTVEFERSPSWRGRTTPAYAATSGAAG